MKRLILLVCAALLAVGCGKDRPKDIPQWNVDDPSAESRPSAIKCIFADCQNFRESNKVH